MQIAKCETTLPKVFVDFHNADSQGRLRLNCIGTIEDLSRSGTALREGDCLTLYSEDLEVDGLVQHSAEEEVWVAAIDWDAICASADSISEADFVITGVLA